MSEQIISIKNLFDDYPAIDYEQELIKAIGDEILKRQNESMKRLVKDLYHKSMSIHQIIKDL